MADTAVSSQLRALLTPKFAGSRRIRLRFSYNRRQYTTVLTVNHDDDELRVFNENKCIDITYNYESASFLTDIRADSGAEACFTPRLVSNARGSAGFRTTTVDVLAVLLTKLYTCFPTASEGVPITITDMASKDDVNLSAFHLLRGGDAIYEKYGYTSPFIKEFKERIRRLRWRDLDTTEKQLILQISQESGLPGFFRNGDLVTDILKPITYDIERAFNARHLDTFVNGGEDVESKNFSESMIIYLTQDTGYDTEFVLDPSSPEWADWSSRLLFTDVAPYSVGGSRRRTQTRRRQRQRQRQRQTRRR